MTEDKNTTTDEMIYTPMLSRFFPSFSGCSTTVEYMDSFFHAFKLFLVWVCLQTVAGICASKFLSLQIFLFISILMLVLFMVATYKDFRVSVRRFHAFGMSWTSDWLIPIIAANVFVIVCVNIGTIALIVAAFVMLIQLIYGIWLYWFKFFRESKWDKKRKNQANKNLFTMSNVKLR